VVCLCFFFFFFFFIFVFFHKFFPPPPPPPPPSQPRRAPGTAGHGSQRLWPARRLGRAEPALTPRGVWRRADTGVRFFFRFKFYKIVIFLFLVKNYISADLRLSYTQSQFPGSSAAGRHCFVAAAAPGKGAPRAPRDAPRAHGGAARAPRRNCGARHALAHQSIRGCTAQGRQGQNVCVRDAFLFFFKIYFIIFFLNFFF
jgi:hypothetical protein